MEPATAKEAEMRATWRISPGVLVGISLPIYDIGANAGPTASV